MAAGGDGAASASGWPQDALISGALASPCYYGGYGGYYAYDPSYYGYYAAPAYYTPYPAYYGGGCWGGGPYWVHRRHWHRW
jgi:hypothetical protein